MARRIPTTGFLCENCGFFIEPYQGEFLRKSPDDPRLKSGWWGIHDYCMYAKEALLAGPAPESQQLDLFNDEEDEEE